VGEGGGKKRTWDKKSDGASKRGPPGVGSFCLGSVREGVERPLLWTKSQPAPYKKEKVPAWESKLSQDSEGELKLNGELSSRII